MKRYNVVFSRRAEKDLQRLPAKNVQQIIPTIVSLQDNPRPAGCKKLKGYKDIWRIRVGDYRVLYAIQDVILLVDVREVGHRRDIYQ